MKYNMAIICTIRNVINLKLDAAEATFIIWGMGINDALRFVLQNFGDTLYIQIFPCCLHGLKSIKFLSVFFYFHIVSAGFQI